MSNAAEREYDGAMNRWGLDFASDYKPRIEVIVAFPSSDFMCDDESQMEWNELAKACFTSRFDSYSEKYGKVCGIKRHRLGIRQVHPDYRLHLRQTLTLEDVLKMPYRNNKRFNAMLTRLGMPF